MSFIRKKIYNRLTEESFDKINNLDKSVDTNKLIFKYKGDTADGDFSVFDNALDFTEKIKNGDISLNEAKDEQEKSKSKNAEIKKVRKKHLSKENKEAKSNIQNIFNARKAASDFFDEHTSRASEARRQAKKGAGLKILPNKCFKDYQ